MKPFEKQTYYELLEVPTTATADEIRGAYAKALELYAPDSPALYGLVADGQAEALRARLLEAMEILTEEDLRDEYDRSLGLPPRAKPVKEEPPPLQLAMTDLLAGAEAVHSTRPEYHVSYIRHLPLPAWEEPAAAAVIASAPSAAPPPGSAAPPPRAAELSPPAAAPPLPPPAPEPVQPPAPSVAAPLPPTVPPAFVVPPPFAAVSLAQPLPPPTAGDPAPERRSAPRGVEPFQEPVTEPVRIPDGEEAVPRGSQPLDAAPEIAQESAIATAESALAQVASRVREPRAEPRKAVEIGAETEFNGELLRQVRMSKEMSLQTLAERTRITSRHLENVEADRYPDLPATVYLRGMLMSIARELQLDGLRVAKSYLSLVGKTKEGK